MIELKAAKLKGAIVKGMKAFKGCKGKIYNYSDDVVSAGLDVSRALGVPAILEIHGFTDGALWLELTLQREPSRPEEKFHLDGGQRAYFHQSGKNYRHCNYLSQEKDATLLLKYYAELMSNSAVFRRGVQCK